MSKDVYIVEVGWLDKNNFFHTDLVSQTAYSSMDGVLDFLDTRYPKPEQVPELNFTWKSSVCDYRVKVLSLK